jgi:phosphoribosylamine--glycine ligase
MNVLVVGGGGREHALAWKLSKSKKVDKLFIAPGNPGTALVGKNVAIKSDDLEGIGALKEFALANDIGLTVVGPEVPLSLGIVDIFKEAGLKIFGPTRSAAELEASKAYSKEFMIRNNIPTAEYKSFDDSVEAKEYVDLKGAPLVVKADGLAAGKGVFICPTTEEAFSAIDEIMSKKHFGEAGSSIVIEEFLVGEEASYLAVIDGENIVTLAPSQDHKAVGENDTGPNTGGMGAYSPAPVVTGEIEDDIIKRVIEPTVRGMSAQGNPFSGLLYAGLMIGADNEIKVLEFNCRFGDPETQPVLMRLKSDLFDLLYASATGELAGVRAEWDPRSAVCVVMSAGGYPGSYAKGDEIIGLEALEAAGGADGDIVVFHAGTALKDGRLVTAGGRVLGVTALGADIKEGIEKAYEAVNKIQWAGAYFRKDIGGKALIPR